MDHLYARTKEQVPKGGLKGLVKVSGRLLVIPSGRQVYRITVFGHQLQWLSARRALLPPLLNV